jgi:hypothetical protein
MLWYRTTQYTMNSFTINSIMRYNKRSVLDLVILNMFWFTNKQTNSTHTYILKHTLNGVGESLFPHTHFTVDYNSNPQWFFSFFFLLTFPFFLFLLFFFKKNSIFFSKITFFFNFPNFSFFSFIFSFFFQNYFC